MCALKIVHVFRLACASYPHGITLSSADRVFVVHADYVNAARNVNAFSPFCRQKRSNSLSAVLIGLGTYNTWVHNILYFISHHTMAVSHGLLEISHAVRRRSDSRNDYIGRYNIIGTYNSDNNIIIVSPVPQHHRPVGGGEKFAALLPDDDGSRRKYI